MKDASLALGLIESCLEGSRPQVLRWQITVTLPPPLASARPPVQFSCHALEARTDVIAVEGQMALQGELNLREEGAAILRELLTARSSEQRIVFEPVVPEAAKPSRDSPWKMEGVALIGKLGGGRTTVVLTVPLLPVDGSARPPVIARLEVTLDKPLPQAVGPRSAAPVFPLPAACDAALVGLVGECLGGAARLVLEAFGEWSLGQAEKLPEGRAPPRDLVAEFVEATDKAPLSDAMVRALRPVVEKVFEQRLQNASLFSADQPAVDAVLSETLMAVHSLARLTASVCGARPEFQPLLRCPARASPRDTASHLQSAGFTESICRERYAGKLFARCVAQEDSAATWGALAAFLQRQQQMPEAEAALRRAMAFDGGTAAQRSTLAGMLLQRERVRGCQELLARDLEEDRTNAIDNLMMAHLLLTRSQSPELADRHRRVAQKRLGRSPGDEDEQVWRSLACFCMDQSLAGLLAELRGYFRLDADFAARIDAHCLLLQRDFAGAERVLAALGCADTAFTHAQLCYRVGRYFTAEELLLGLIKQGAGASVEVALLLGYTLLARGAFADAAVVAARIVALIPQAFWGWLLFAQAEFHCGRRAHAEEALFTASMIERDAGIVMCLHLLFKVTAGPRPTPQFAEELARLITEAECFDSGLLLALEEACGAAELTGAAEAVAAYRRALG